MRMHETWARGACTGLPERSLPGATPRDPASIADPRAIHLGRCLPPARAAGRLPAGDEEDGPARGAEHGLAIRTEVGIAPNGTDGATGDGDGMSQIWSVRAQNAAEPKHITAGSAERHADVTDAADPATRERDEVEDCGLASFPASDPPSWGSGG
jgi:hypothetical protein